MGDYVVRVAVHQGQGEPLIPFDNRWSFGDFSLLFSYPARDYWHEALCVDEALEELEEGEELDLPIPTTPDKSDDLPETCLYIEFPLTVDDPLKRYSEATKTIDHLETLLRLFKPGCIYLRRYGIWKVQESGNLEIDDYWNEWHSLPRDDVRIFRKSMQQKPPPALEEEMGDYNLDDKDVRRFVDFFERYWHPSLDWPEIGLALRRFSQSYERLYQDDRLVDLMIAMEVVFGERDMTSSKIASRSSWFLYPPGKARKKAFGEMKRLYGKRSDIVHGRKTNVASAQEVDLFEGFVRSSLVKCLAGFEAGALDRALGPSVFDNFQQEWRIFP